MEAELDYTAIGVRIRQAREKQHLTQEQLGEACSLSAAHIGHIERGTRILSVDALFKISCILKVSTDFLLFDSVNSDESFLISIESLLKAKDKNKVRTFLNTVKILVDNIDKL